MMHRALSLSLILLSVCNGYILGEDENDPNFMRCWQNGNLMIQCPSGLGWNWNLSQSEVWHENEEYAIQINMTWDDSFRSHIVQQTATSQLVPHINVHSCKFALGKVCIPFIGANGDSVSHTSVISSDNDGLFVATVSLTEGQWNVIAHGRLYLNDTTHYALEGEAISCDNNSNNTVTPFPWKLDFAIGLPHAVEPPIIIDVASTTSIAGWQIFVVIICVIGAVGVAYKFYKYYQNKESVIAEKESPESQLKRALIFELSSLTVSFGLATFDWVTDTVALVSVQATDDLNQMLVVVYFGMVIMISLFYFYVVYSAVIDIIAVMNEYKNGLNDVIQVKSTNAAIDDDEDKLVKSGNINYEFSRVRRGITTEKVSFFMAIVEDLPMFIFNAVLLFYYDVESTALLLSFITNAIILGYKFSGIERLWYLTQLKTKIDSMITAVRLSRQITNNDINITNDTKQRLQSIEHALINNDLDPANKYQA